MSQFLRTRVTAVTLTIAFLAGATVSAQTDLSRGAVGLAQAPTPPAGEVVRRLSLDDAVKLALEQNLGIRIQRIDPQIQDVGVAQARSFWAPNLATTFTRNAQSQR